MIFLVVAKNQQFKYYSLFEHCLTVALTQQSLLFQIDQVEVEQMFRENTAKKQAETEQKMAEKEDTFVLKELRQALELDDKEKLKRQEQQQLINVNLEDALRKLKYLKKFLNC